MVPNRQVVKRHQFILFEKMAAVRQIQQNAKSPIFTTKDYITWKRYIVRMQEKQNNKAKSMCLGPSSFEDKLLCDIFELREKGMTV